MFSISGMHRDWFSGIQSDPAMPDAISYRATKTKVGARNYRPLRNELRDLFSPPRQAETGEGLPDTTRNAGSGTGSGAAGGPLAANSETIEPNFTADYASEPHPLPVCVQVGMKAQLVLSSADFWGGLRISSAHSATSLSSAQRCPGSDTSFSGIAWRIPYESPFFAISAALRTS